MRINKIHPESIRKYRDNNYQMIKNFDSEKMLGIYLKFLPKNGNVVEKIKSMREAIIKSDMPIETIELFENYLHDPSIWRTLMSFDHYESYKHDNYIFAEKFWKDLKRTNLKGLRIADILSPINAYIHLAGGIDHYDGRSYTDLYVQLKPYQELDIPKDSFVSVGGQEQLDNYSDYFIQVCLHSRERLFQWSARIPKDTSKSAEFFAKNCYSDVEGKCAIQNDLIFEFVSQPFKMLAYIHSGQPDIREFRNEIAYRGNSKTQVVKKDRILSQENIHLVGYNWKKAPIYHVDSTRVSGHFRWQRYDKGLSKVKLTWINEHERNFRKPGNDSRSLSTGLIQ